MTVKNRKLRADAEQEAVPPIGNVLAEQAIKKLQRISRAIQRRADDIAGELKAGDLDSERAKELSNQVERLERSYKAVVTKLASFL